MTLNQAIKRIKLIVLAHRQVRTFDVGNVSDFLVDRTTKYAAVFLQYASGIISTSQKLTSISYRMFFLDLVHVSEDSKDNEQDVLSDMLSVAMDIVAQLNAPQYNDWRLSTDNNLQIVTEDNGDMYAGFVLDFTLSFMFTQNRCEIPADIIYDEANIKLMYDISYPATGNEGNTLSTVSIPELSDINGKKILLITRELAPLYPVSNNPSSSEYTWNNKEIGLGAITGPGERFLILYRTY